MLTVFNRDKSSRINAAPLTNSSCKCMKFYAVPVDKKASILSSKLASRRSCITENKDLKPQRERLLNSSSTFGEPFSQPWYFFGGAHFSRTHHPIQCGQCADPLQKLDHNIVAARENPERKFTFLGEFISKFQQQSLPLFSDMHSEQVRDWAWGRGQETFFEKSQTLLWGYTTPPSPLFEKICDNTMIHTSFPRGVAANHRQDDPIVDHLKVDRSAIGTQLCVPIAVQWGGPQ